MRILTTRELKIMRENGADFTLVNVLPEEYYRKEHIPGSRNVPVTEDDFVRRIEEIVPDKSRTVVVYCACRECTASSTAAGKLDQAGFTDVRDYETGVRGWRGAGLPLRSVPEDRLSLVGGTC
ncbi:MAG: rhodanese-like domain-containing protein [Elusimicrobiota bacterium]